MVSDLYAQGHHKMICVSFVSHGKTRSHDFLDDSIASFAKLARIECANNKAHALRHTNFQDTVEDA